MSQSKPTEKLEDAAKLMTAAAVLHLSLSQNATEDIIAKALQWRYGVTPWESQQCYRSAMTLLDNMPEARR